MPSWLLLLQLLIVILLAVALARPQLGGAAEAADHWIVLFDVSASMSTRDGAGGDQTRFEEASYSLQRNLQRMAASASGEKPVISLLSVGPSVAVTGARLENAQEVRQALSRLEPSDGAALWQNAAALVPGLIIGEESVHVMVLSDGAGAAAAVAAVEVRLPDLPLALLEFGAGADNAGLGAVTVELVDYETGVWQVEGTVNIFAENPAPVPLTAFFTPEGTEGALPWSEHELDPGDDTSFSFELELPGAGLLELRLPEDALLYDNRVQMWLEAAPRTARVLTVGPENPPLQRALEAIDGLELYRADTLPEASEEFDLVIVDRVAVPRHPGTHTLWLGGASLEGERPGELVDVTLTGWDTAHPLSTSIDWGTVEVEQGFQVPLLSGARSLLEASGGPLVQARTTGVGREVVVAFDLSQHAWTEELSFPVFTANLMRWVAPWRGQVTGPFCTVGQVCYLEPRVLYSGTSLIPFSGDEDALALPSPFISPSQDSPPEQAWTPEGFLEVFVPRKAGLFRLGPGGEFLTIRAPAGSESDVRAPATADGTADGIATASLSWPLYRWLLLAALVLLLAELWLAGRGSEHFLHRAVARPPHPLARRYRIMLGLRILAALLVTLALLDVPWLLPQREQRLVVLLDDSGIYDEDAQLRMNDVLAKAARPAGMARRVGAVYMGRNVQVMASLGETPSPLPPYDLHPGADLSVGLNLAAGLLGERRPGRIAVMTSGVQTQGNAAHLLPELTARATPVDVVPLGGVPAGEVLVQTLSVPSRLYAGDAFSLQGVVYSSVATAATVRLWREGDLYNEQRVELSPGANRIETELEEETPGRYLYEYEVVVEDKVSENNRDGLVAEVLPRAEVALITPQASWGEVLADLLEVQDISAEIMPPSRAPYSLEDLLPYDAVILANVPAIGLHSSQQELLETWVEEYGGGLLILGGENTFGPGGYFQTPLERISPLSSRVPQDAPKVAMLFVLDRSGSMQQRVGEVTRLDIAKQATIDAAELLNPESLTGIVVFDSEATMLVPLQSLATGAGLAEALGPLQAGGGTSLYPALVAAYEQMREVDAATRHIVVMTDGLSQPGDFDTILSAILESGITVSTVSIGQGADTSLLQSIARRGGGAFHATTDFRALPSILSQEALMLSGTPVKEEAFVPLWQNREAVFLQKLPTELPPLFGYVQTTAKEAAAVHLLGPEEAPILASWRYGLGRVVAFASQGAGLWTQEWLDSTFYPLLWSQAVRWVLPPVVKPGLNLEFSRTGDEVGVRVQAVGEDGAPAGDLSLEAQILSPDREGRTLELLETEPGVYRGIFVAEQAGRYQVRVTADEEVPLTADGEVFVGYPARYAFGDAGGAETLRALAAATGGRVILDDEPLPSEPSSTRWRWRQVLPLWVVLGLGLFLLELLLRYAPSSLRLPMRTLGKRKGGAAVKT